MTQFDHTLIATVLTMITGILFKDYLIFPEDWEWGQKKVDEWIDL